MFLVLVNILVVWVARENAASLGAPATIRSVDTRHPVINATAQHTETVPVSVSPFYEVETHRKVSAQEPDQILSKHVQHVETPLPLTPRQNYQNSDSSLGDKNDNNTERTASTVYNFQSSTTKELTFEELLNLARMKYLGHNIRGKTNTARTFQPRNPKSRVELNSRRKIIIEINKQRQGHHQTGFGSSRLKLTGVKAGGTSITQAQKPVSIKKINDSVKAEITTTAKVQKIKELKTELPFEDGQIKRIREDKEESINASANSPYKGVTINTAINSNGSMFETSLTRLDISLQTTLPTTRNEFTPVLALNKAHSVSISPDNSPPRKRMTKMTDMFHLMSTDEAQSMISHHHGRSLSNQGEYVGPNIQNVFSDPKGKLIKLKDRGSPDLEFIKPSTEEENVSKPFIEEPESYNDNTEGSGGDDLDIFDGQYYEVNPGQYHEVNPGQYHEVNPGQYHELNPGQYHETHPGQYHEINPGQEVQLNVEFNPEEETKTYNVHKKTGDYIIGEVGKINVNNGQTLEGVRYTAVDGIVDQEQIAEILQRFFGTKTN